MAKEDDEIVVICGPDAMGDHKVIDVTCRSCGAEVLLSDSSIRSMKSQNPERDFDSQPPVVLCVICGLSYMQTKGDDLQIAPLTEEQINELKNGISKLWKES